MCSFPRTFLIAICLIVSALPALSDIRLPSLLANNMVLQRNADVKLWGWANPSEKLTVTTSWNNKTDSAVTSGDARWELVIKTPGAGGPFTITFRGHNTVTLQNILIGEVWVCSGQSNMEWSAMQGLKEIDTEMTKNLNPDIRFFNVTKSTADYPQDNCIASWEVCNPTSLKSFSAIGYFFGKKLSEELKVPVGLINSSWGGTPAEVWTPANAVINNDTLQSAAMKLNVSPWWPTKPGKAYNAMIAPLLPFRIAGALWYQGESNTGTADSYKSLFTGMIDNWRKGWNQDFPFYFVQIAPYTYGNKNIGALLREAQSNAQAHPKTGMVVITDLVEDVKDIHPRQKNAVAVRLANYALSNHYSRTGISYRSPLYKSMSVQGNKALLTFDHAENGFITRGGKAVEWFVAGDDKIFYPADISISKNIISVSSPKVRIPVAVRFGFSNEAIGNVFNKEGLPVNPFRTDNWPVDTSKIN